jgi:hypothetical protein
MCDMLQRKALWYPEVRGRSEIALRWLARGPLSTLEVCARDDLYTGACDLTHQSETWSKMKIAELDVDDPAVK